MRWMVLASCLVVTGCDGFEIFANALRGFGFVACEEGDTECECEHFGECERPRRSWQLF